MAAPKLGDVDEASRAAVFGAGIGALGRLSELQLALEVDALMVRSPLRNSLGFLDA